MKVRMDFGSFMRLCVLLRPDNRLSIEALRQLYDWYCGDGDWLDWRTVENGLFSYEEYPSALAFFERHDKEMLEEAKEDARRSGGDFDAAVEDKLYDLLTGGPHEPLYYSRPGVVKPEPSFSDTWILIRS